MLRSLTSVLRLMPLGRVQQSFHSSIQLRRADGASTTGGVDASSGVGGKSAVKKSRQVIDDLFSLIESQQPRREQSSGGDGVGGVGDDDADGAYGGGDSAEAFEYWSLYPKKVRKWLINLRSPRGHYNSEGEFVPSGMWEAEEEEALPLVLRPIHNFHGPEKILDSDIAGGYRFGIKPEELADVDPKIKNLLSLRNANKMEIHAYRKQQNLEKWGDMPHDSGKTEVQIANLTVRIKYLGEHMTAHHKDKHTAYGLNKLVHRRRALLRYLKKNDVARYYKLIVALQLRDVV